MVYVGVAMKFRGLRKRVNGLFQNILAVAPSTGEKSFGSTGRRFAGIDHGIMWSGWISRKFRGIETVSKIEGRPGKKSEEIKECDSVEISQKTLKK
jgi:hypothetical protein